MGKKRIAVIGEEQPEKKAKKPAEEKKEVHIPGMKGGARVAIVGAELPPEKEVIAPEETVPTKTIKKRGLPRAKARGKNYLSAKMKIDPTRTYSLSEAIKLARETSWGKFDGSFEAHLVTTKTGLRGEAKLPYLAGKTRKVEIASKDTLAKIESGKIDFDILISTPAFMANLVKYAKILGPRGLMPNPKAGTIVENPEKVASSFQKETFSFKTEANTPLIHSVVGKISQKDEELEANLKALLSAVGTKNIKKAVICASMGPAVKLAIDNL